MKASCKNFRAGVCKVLSAVMLFSSVSVNSPVMAEESVILQDSEPVQAQDVALVDEATTPSAVDEELTDEVIIIDENAKADIAFSAGESTDAEEAESESSIVSYSDGIVGGSILFDKETGTITGGDSTVTEIVIPKEIEGVKVTKIGANAFDYTDLISVTLNGQIEEIGEYAFYGTDITEFVADESLKKIGNYAFYSCSYLKSVELKGDSLEIGDYAFAYAYNIEQLVFGDGVKSIGNNAFYYIYSNQKKLELPEGLETIGEYAFYYANISELIIPDSVTSIGMSAFSSNYYLTSVKLGDGLTDIPNDCFNYCYELNEIEFGKNIESIGSYAFYGSNFEEGLELPSTLKTIGNYAFYNYSHNELVIPENVESIGSYAFYSGKIEKITFMCENLSINEYSFDGKNMLCLCPSDCKTYNGLSEKGYIVCDKDSFLTYEDENGTYWLDEENQVLLKYDVDATEIVIPEEIGGVKIKKLGNGLFKSSSAITSVTLPDTIEEIGSFCFYNCSSLSAVNNAGNVKKVGDYAFYGCSSIKEISFGSVESLGDYCFYTCYALNSASGLSSLEVISDYCFNNSGLSTLESLPAIKEIGAYAFSYSSLKEITIGDDIRYIGANAFYDCTDFVIHCSAESYALDYAKAKGISYEIGDNVIIYGATGGNIYISKFDGEITGCDASVVSAIIPERVNGVEIKGVRSYAFDGCALLSELVLPDTVEKIEAYAINNCDALKTLVLSNNTSSMAGYAVYSCDALTELEIKGKGAIPNYAVYYCSKLTKVTFGEGITSIGNYAATNNNLTYLSLPSTLETISSSALNCTGYSSVYSNGSYQYIYGEFECYQGTAGQQFFENKGLGYTVKNGCIALPNVGGNIYVSSADGRVTKADPSVTEATIPDEIDGVKITSVNPYAFRYCSSLRTISFGENIAEINANVISGTSSLTKFIVKNKDAVVPGYSFLSGRSNLVVYCLSGSTMEEFCKTYNNKYVCLDGEYQLEVNGGYINFDTARGYITGFSGSPTEVEIPAEINGTQITGVDTLAFNGCTSLTRLELPDTITYIGANAFYNCSKLKLIELPSKLEQIGNYAFYNCDGLTIYSIPDSVTMLGEYAFSNCDGIEQISIGSGVENISNYAFYYCKKLKDINIEGVSSIGQYAFGGCTALEMVQLPDSVTTIGNYAFYNDTLVKITEIPDSITSLGQYAFYGTGIESITIGSGLTELNGFGYCRSLTSITIPETITSIGNNAFNYCTSLASITIPDSVTTIGGSAFSNCSKLTELIIPSTVQTIGSSAFSNCSGIKEIVIPEGIQKLSVDMFYGCSLLESVTLPESLTYIDSYAFQNCSSLAAIDIPKSVTTIGSYAFYNSGIAEIKLPDGLTSLGSSAFYSCDSLKSIAIPESVTYLNSYLFAYCSALEEVILHNKLTAIYSDAFNNCKALKSIDIPDSVTSIGSEAFYSSGLEYIYLGESIKTISKQCFAYCYSLKSADIISATSIGDRAFYNASALESVSLPAALSTISSYAFYGTALKEISFGPNVTSLGSYSLNNCSQLADIYVYNSSLSLSSAFSTIPQVVIHCYENSTAQTFAKNNNLEYVLLTGAYNAETTIAVEGGNIYINNANKKIVSADSTITAVDLSEIDIEIKGIGNQAFANCTLLTSVKLSDDIETIGVEAFDGCTSLEEIDLASVKSIGAYAFENCYELDGVELPETVEIIGNYAFSYCSGLTEILIPETVKELGNSIFNYCSDLESAEIECSITELNYGMFYDCSSLSSVVLPDTVEVIGERAFYYCSSLTELPSCNLTEIGDYAFYYCSGLTSLELPETVKKVGNNAFYGCSGIKEISLGAVEEIGSSVFSYCSGITKVEIPESLKALGNSSFYCCTGLSDVSLGTVERIGSYAFYNCTSLAEIELPETIENMDSGAFNNCSGLKKVELPDSLESLSPYTFYGCSKLKEVDLGNVTAIAYYAFYNCSSLESIDLTNVKAIGNYAFYNCKLSELDAKSIETIGNYAFYQNPFTSVVIPRSVKNIGESAFYYCNMLEAVEIQDGVEGIDNYAFANCNKLAKLVIPDSVTDISQSAFHNSRKVVIYCNQGSYAHSFAKENSIKYVLSGNLLEYQVEGGKLYIDPESGIVVMADNTITRAIIPSEVEGVEITAIANIFENNTKLVEVSLPDTITDIPQYAFYYCSSLERVTIGSGIKTIGHNAFYNCQKLSEVISESDIETIGQYAFYDCYKLSDFNFGSSLTQIDYGAFEYSGLKSISLPDTLETIGGYAFYRCSSLEGADLGEGVKSIGGYAFGYSALKSIEIPGSVETISDNAFYRCSSLEGADLGEGVKSIGSYAFHYSALKSIEIPGSVETIGSYAFYSCPIEELTIPKSVTTIGSSAFSNSSTMFSVYPDSAALNYMMTNNLKYRLICDINISVQGNGSVDPVGNVPFIYGDSLTITAAADEGSSLVGYVVSGDSGREVYTTNLSETITVKNIRENKTIKVIFAEEVNEVTDIEFESDELRLEYGSAAQEIKYMVYPEDATIGELNFTSNDLSIVTITKDGKVLPRGIGHTTIIASTNDGLITKALDVYVEDTTKPVFYSKPETTIVAGTTIGIKWGGAGDAAGIEKYVVSRDGEVVAETAAISFIDTDLTIDTTYVYEIKAVDVNGNESDTYSITATTCVPTGNIQPYPVSGSVIGGSEKETIGVITSKLATNETRTLAVQYSFNGSTWVSLPEKDILGVTYSNSSETRLSAYFDTNGLASGAYTVKYIVSSSRGTTDEATAVYVVDNEAPKAPANLVATPGELISTLTWNEGVSADTAGYYIYRSESADGEFKKVGTVSGRSNVYYVDKALSPEIKYYYYVTSYDSFEQISESSNVVEVTPLTDTQAPNILGLQVNGKESQGFTVSGNAKVLVSAIDNHKVSTIDLLYSIDGGETFEIYDTNRTNAQEVSTSFTVDTTKFDSNKIIFKVNCTDFYGNTAYGANTYSFNLDNTAPEKVSGLRAEVQATIITLSWNDVPDDDRSYFIVEEKDGDKFVQIMTVSDKNGCNITKAVPDTTYTYRVCAVDIYGNKGEYSSEISATTKNDTTCPVVKDISPKQSAYNGKFVVSVSVEDDYAIDYVEIKTSSDALNWEVYAVEDVVASSSACTVKTTIDVSEMEDGSIYVKAVPVDYAGNRGDEENTTYVQYLIDHTAPEAPNGVTAKASGDSILVSWSYNDDDVKSFDVYKSDSEDGPFLKLRSNVRAVGIYDSNCIREKDYFYYVVAHDVAGNTSENSLVVSAALTPDYTKPVVSDIAPGNGSTLAKNGEVAVLFTDNYSLEKVIVQYLNNKDEWVDVVNTSATGTSFISKFNVEDQMVSSGAVSFRAYAVDSNNNISDYRTFGYKVNAVIPDITSFTCEAGVESVEINAEYVNNNIISIYLYRMDESSSSREYTFLANFAVNEEGKISYTDTTASSASTYSYKLVVTNSIGNSKYEVVSGVSPEKLTAKNDKVAPIAVITAPNTAIAGSENYYDASKSTDNFGISNYKWDFGDGTTSISVMPVHIYEKAGSYTVTLNVTDVAGNVGTATKTVEVKDEDKIGTVTVKVVDNYGEVVSGAGVYVNLGADNMYTELTNYKGICNIVEEEGVYTIGIYADGYLPVKKAVTVENKVTKEVVFNVVKEDLVVGELTHHKMTLEEIEAAGIDITQNENKYVYEYVVNFKIEETVYDFKYHANLNGIIGGGRLYIGGSGGGYHIQAHHLGTDKNSKPKTIVTLIKIPGSVSWVKDFFEVELTVVNQADSSFYIRDSLVEFNVPSGLTIVEANGYCATAQEYIGNFYGGESHTTKWVVRGDADGSYDISADFDGVLADFEEPVHFEFKADEPIVVDGGSNLNMTILCEDIVGGAFDYAMRVGLTNMSNETVSMSSVRSTVLGYSGFESFKEKTNGALVGTGLESIEAGETLWDTFVIPREEYKKMVVQGNPNRANKVTPGTNREVESYIATGQNSNVQLPTSLEIVNRFDFAKDKIEVFNYNGGGMGAPFETGIITNDSLNEDYSLTRPGLVVRVQREHYDKKYYPIKTDIEIEDNAGNVKKYMTDRNGLAYIDGETIELDEDDWGSGSNNSVPDINIGYTIRSGRGSKKISFIGRDDRNGEGVVSGTVIGWKDGKAIALKDFTVSALGVSATTDQYGKFKLTTPNKGKAEFVITGTHKDTKYTKRMDVKIIENTVADFEIGLRSEGKATFFGETVMKVGITGDDGKTKEKDYSRVVLPCYVVKGNILFTAPITVVNTGVDHKITSIEGRIVHKDGTYDTMKMKIGYHLIGEYESKLGDEPYVSFEETLTNFKPGDRIEYYMTLLTPDGVEFPVFGEPSFYAAENKGELEYANGFSFSPDGMTLNVDNEEIEIDMSGLEDILDEDGDIDVGEKAPKGEKDTSAGALADKTNESSEVKFGIEPLSFDFTGEYDMEDGLYSFSNQFGGGANAEFEMAKYNLLGNSIAVTGELDINKYYIYDVENDEWLNYNGMAVGGEAELEVELPSIPLYTGITLEISLLANTSTKVEWEANNPLSMTQLQIDSSLIPNKTEFGVGGGATAMVEAVKGLLGLGAYFNLGLSFNKDRLRYRDRYAYVTASLDCGFKERFFWVINLEQEAYANEWTILDTRNLFNHAIEETELQLYAAAQPNEGRSWNGNISDEERATLMTGAFSNNMLSVVELDDNSKLMVFADYTENDEANPLRLKYSVYQNGKWSTPEVICDDGTVDMAPILEKTENGAKVMWINMDEALGADETVLTKAEIIENYISKLNVYSADFDLSSKSWSEQTKLSDNGQFSYLPAFASNGNSSMVAYVSSKGTSGTSEAPAKLNFVYTSGDEVVTSGAIDITQFNISDVNVGYDENGYILTYQDAESSLIYSTRFSGSSWSYPKRISSNSSAELYSDLVKVEDKLVLYYVKNDSIYCKNLTDNTDEAVVVSSDKTGTVGGLSVFVDSKGKEITLGWYAAVDGIYQVVVNRYDEEAQCYGDGIVVSQLDGRTVPTTIEVEVEEAGISTYYTAMTILEDGSDNVSVEYAYVPMNSDLTPVNVECEGAIPGAENEMIVDIENLGLAAAEDYTIIIADNIEGSNPIASTDLNTVIVSGGSSKVFVDFVMPETEDNSVPEIYVIVKADNDSNADNNYIRLDIAAGNLEIADVDLNKTLETNVLTNVRNNSFYNSDSFKVVVRDTVNYEVIAEATVDGISAAESQDVKVIIGDLADELYNEDRAVIQISIESADNSEVYDSTLILVNKPKDGATSLARTTYALIEAIEEVDREDGEKLRTIGSNIEIMTDEELDYLDNIQTYYDARAEYDDLYGINVLYGDVDNNGTVSAEDSAAALQHVLSAEDNPLDEFGKLRTDVNIDDVITAADAAMILNRVLNSEFIFPVEENI